MKKLHSLLVKLGAVATLASMVFTVSVSAKAKKVQQGQSVEQVLAEDVKDVTRADGTFEMVTADKVYADTITITDAATPGFKVVHGITEFNPYSNALKIVAEDGPVKLSFTYVTTATFREISTDEDALARALAHVICDGYVYIDPLATKVELSPDTLDGINYNTIVSKSFNAKDGYDYSLGVTIRHAGQVGSWVKFFPSKTAGTPVELGEFGAPDASSRAYEASSYKENKSYKYYKGVLFYILQGKGKVYVCDKSTQLPESTADSLIAIAPETWNAFLEGISGTESGIQIASTKIYEQLAADPEFLKSIQELAN